MRALADVRVLVALARMLPATLLSPALGRSTLGRVGVALLLTALIAPTLPASVAAPMAWRELLVGATLGLVSAVPFAAAKSAGALVDRSRDPRATGTLSMALALFALALFAAMNGPRLIVVAIAQSYDALPVAGAATTAGVSVALDAGARLIGAGLTLAAPALAALVLVELMLGLVARAQPLAGEVVEAAPLATLAVVIVLSLGALGLASSLLDEGGLGGLAGSLADAAQRLR